MNKELLRLAQRIIDELDNLERLSQRTLEGWNRFLESSDDFYLDGVALNLHSFYNGLERVFELIARKIDGTLPQEATWHQLLLEQMTVEIPNIRPAVISQNSRQTLDEYRRFRHVVRNVYAFNFDAARLQPIVQNVSNVMAQIRLELLAFAAFLENNAHKESEGDKI